MTSRAQQRQQTRTRIVAAAIDAFAANGFDGSGTRDIAARADVTQGLLTYHFESKLALWQSAADQLFAELTAVLSPDDDAPAPISGREAVRRYVVFAARRPELFHFLVDAGRHDDDRMRYLVDNHLPRRFTNVAALAADDLDPAHVYYALAGAASLIFGVAPECRRLAGVDANADAVVERHADYVADLFVPTDRR